MAVTIRQLKAARALLAWSQEELASQSSVSIPTVKRIEAQDGPVGGRADTAKKLRTALERAGVEFIAENGGGAGVRLAQRSEPASQGPVDAPMVRAGREMKATNRKRKTA